MGKLTIVGDLFPVKSNLDQFLQGDVVALFGKKISELLAKSDFRICNLEGALTDGQERMAKTGPVITAPTGAVNAYKALGIDLCLLANNHITDAGNMGMASTMSILDKEGISFTGAGMDERSIPHSHFITIDGKKVCIYNVCETMYNKPSSSMAGAWLYDEYIVCNELLSIKKQCDYIVVAYHGGIEKFRYPSPETKKRFHRMADCGADVILSQHTHCIGCEEYYNGSYLLYGQGDFLFNNFKPELTDKGLVIELIIDGSGLSVRKHMVQCTSDYRLQYIENPSFFDFEERSSHLDDDAYLDVQFQKFCKRELRLYLTAFKSPGYLLRIFRRLFPKHFNKWLCLKAFRRKDLMFALHTLRSEQNRETAIAGIEGLLNTFTD